MIASEPLATALARLQDFWQGQKVILLAARFNDTVRALIEEITHCGATVAAIITGSSVDGEPLPTSNVWRNAVSSVTRDRHAPDNKSAFDAWTRNPPVELRAWLDKLDPSRRWPVLGTLFTAMPEFCGRPVHGWRRPQWAKLEDKTRIDQLWQRLGIPSPAYTVCAADDPMLHQWIAKLDGGLGVVLAIDSSRGFLGDAHGLRWLRNAFELEDTIAWFKGRTSQVRIAEFVSGVPCSILGMVLANGVAVFEPIEIVTLRRMNSSQFVFCGSSTYWRPEPSARAAMRRYARLVGQELAISAGYRGIYSVDGILGKKGFMVTELNPRHASGLGLRAGCPDFPCYLFNRAVQQNIAGLADMRALEIEKTICAIVQRHPSCMIRLASLPINPSALSKDADKKTNKIELTSVQRPCPIKQNIYYQVEPDAIKVRHIEPALDDGAIAPATAALASLLSADRFGCFLDDVCSSGIEIV